MKKKLVLGVVAAMLFILCACNNTSAPEIPERYIEAISTVKNDLKDPTSMRVYGDVLVGSQLDSSTLESTGVIFISIVYDGKNSFGSYGGKSEALIVLSPDDDPMYVNDDSSQFISVRDLYESYEGLAQMMEAGEIANERIEEVQELLNSFSFEVLDGEAVAKAIDAEYFES